VKLYFCGRGLTNEAVEGNILKNKAVIFTDFKALFLKGKRNNMKNGVC
jgi:hypothetical protein